MLWCAVGLPGVGKTTFLRNAELRADFAVRELDAWIADTRLEHPPFTSAGEIFRMVKNTTPERYITEQRSRGRRVARAHRDALRGMMGSGAYVLELTPFLWSGVELELGSVDLGPPPVCSLTVGRENHLARLLARFGAPQEEVAALDEWLRAAGQLTPCRGPSYRIDVPEQSRALVALLAEQRGGQTSCAR